MKKSELKSLIGEAVSEAMIQKSLQESFNSDIAFLEQKLIEEGLWDTIKQKAGGVFDKAGQKAKEFLLRPLIKVIMDKVAKDDPQGYAQLQQYAIKDPSNLVKLMDHPDIKKQQNKVEKELQSVKESLDEGKMDDFIQEYIDAVLEEARVLKDDPINARRRERYAQRKAARSKTEPSAGDNIKKGSEQLGKGLAQGADKLGIAAIEKTGDFIKGASNLVGKAMDTKAGQAAKSAVGGLVGKVYGWIKQHPKITASVALGLVGALFTAASIGSGGIVPLITSTLAAAGGGAIKGGAIGSAIGAGKEMYSQIKGGAKSFKDMDYGKVAKAGLKSGGKGAAIGAVVGGGANVLGKAALGAKDVFSGEYGKAMRGDGGYLRDMTPGEKRAFGAGTSGEFNVVNGKLQGKLSDEQMKYMGDLLKTPDRGAATSRIPDAVWDQYFQQKTQAVATSGGGKSSKVFNAARKIMKNAIEANKAPGAYPQLYGTAAEFTTDPAKLSGAAYNAIMQAARDAGIANPNQSQVQMLAKQLELLVASKTL